MPDWNRLEALRERPAGRAVMLQTWHDLLFLHSRVPVDAVQRLLPPGVEVETFDGVAWLGLVPFRMSGIRPPWLPAAPWLSAFPETNIRTYVTCNGEPGVWFFSLDAARWLACWFARKSFALPYFHSRMSVTKDAHSIIYKGQRADANYEISAPLPAAFSPAERETFEFWLIERYLLFSVRQHKLYRGQVNHAPYQIASLDPAQVQISESLTSAAGMRDLRWEHACFSPGVSVEVFGLQQI